MLLASWELLLHDPVSFLRLTVLVAIAVIAAITVHEFNHAFVAHRLGDATAHHQGRCTLNPLRHLDPAGTLMMFIAGFGWGKPVPVNPNQVAHGVKGTSLVAAAGPFSNLILAFLLGIPLQLGVLDSRVPGLDQATYVMTGGFLPALSDILGLVIFFNLLLAVFNFIPLAPLDGSRVLEAFIPESSLDSYSRFQRYGPVLLVGIIMLDYALGLGILWKVIGPVVGGLTSLATGF